MDDTNNSIEETTTPAAPLDAPRVVFTKTGRAEWLDSIREDNERDTVTNAREHAKNPDRRNPHHFLFMTINTLAGKLDEMEAELQQLRGTSRR